MAAGYLETSFSEAFGTYELEDAGEPCIIERGNEGGAAAARTIAIGRDSHASSDEVSEKSLFEVFDMSMSRLSPPKHKLRLITYVTYHVTGFG